MTNLVTVPLFGERYVRLAFAEADEARLREAVAADGCGILAGRFGAAEDVAALSARLSVIEAETGRPDGGTRIAALVDNVAATFQLPTFARRTPRLAALGIDCRALAAELGLSPDNHAAAPIATARGLCVLVARAAGVSAFEVLQQNGSITERMRMSRTDGFAAVVTLSRDEE